MNNVESENRAICPYWRRFIISGKWTVALCGADSPADQGLPENDLVRRLKECPWYGEDGINQAYIFPSVVMTDSNSFDVIATAVQRGSWGIHELEEKWEPFCEAILPELKDSL